MFAIEHINAAHARVKSGADFPVYIQDLKKLGVISYETHVVDGHTDYHGIDTYSVSSPAGHERLIIADVPNKEHFTADLHDHQRGKTDYPTFCTDAAKSGIEKWVADLTAMTCTYFDRGGSVVLVEKIPQ